MKIYLIDFNENIINAWKHFFYDEDVIIVNDTLHNFLNNNPEIEVIVSPANSFGIMNGGYDAAITRYFGKELQNKVQEYILTNLCGEQPVGTSFAVKIPNYNKYLIHTPTMRTPERIVDPRIIYHCMRSTLMEAYKLNINSSILIPAFGGATGGIEPTKLAKYMYLGYKQINDYIKNKPTILNWETILRI